MRWLFERTLFSAPKPRRPPVAAELRWQVGNLASRVKRDAVVERAPLGMVERVVRFQAKLNASLPSLTEMFLNRLMSHFCSPGPLRRSSRIHALAALLRGREARGIDERIDAARYVGIAGEDDARCNVFAARDLSVQRCPGDPRNTISDVDRRAAGDAGQTRKLPAIENQPRNRVVQEDPLRRPGIS